MSEQWIRSISGGGWKDTLSNTVGFLPIHSQTLFSEVLKI